MVTLQEVIPLVSTMMDTTDTVGEVVMDDTVAWVMTDTDMEQGMLDQVTDLRIMDGTTTILMVTADPAMEVMLVIHQDTEVTPKMWIFSRKYLRPSWLKSQCATSQQYLLIPF